jgi:PRTRC genetic system ThiF family protein
MHMHKIHPQLLARAVRIDVIGAGGTGSQLIIGLARLHLALLALGHPYGLHVTLWDDDIVSDANVGRQSFFPCDVGSPKASTLINRINAGFGLQWKSNLSRVDTTSRLECEIVIGCVDNRKARHAILTASSRGCVRYWLDCGNQLESGQVILGELTMATSSKKGVVRLPHAADLFPDLIDGNLDKDDDIPSCSLADALEKQSLFINGHMALSACNLLSELFRHGEISYHGVFVNLKSGRTNPLQVDNDTWKRFNYPIPKPRVSRKVIK